MTTIAPIRSAFVTGSTGLLGNNLVRLLVSRGVKVQALARSAEKAETQFASLPVKIVEGDMNNVAAFADQLRDIEVVFASERDHIWATIIEKLHRHMLIYGH